MNRRRNSLSTLALVAAWLTAGSAYSQDVKVEKYVLPNGMTVILHEDHSLPVAAVNIWFKVGSKDEAERRSGFAHLFEHLMFMGTDRVPTGMFDKIMEGGGGSNNASTAEDRTNYFESGPSSLLPTLLWLEADRLEDLGRTMTKKKLDLQRDVVKNERRQTTENTPYGKATEAINGLMYPVGHPYHTSVIGSHEDLEAASVKDVQDFFATYYVPNNASMVVAGDFNPETIKPMIAKLFGTLPRQNDVPRKSVPSASFSGVRRMTMVDTVQNSRTYMVWPSPAAYKSGDVEITLASSILAGGVSSRLYRRLVTQEKVATDVSAFQNSLLLGSYFAIIVTAEKGSDMSKIEASVDDELTKFIKSGPTPEELKRQSASFESAALAGLQSASSKADKLNEYEFYFGEPNSFKRVLDQVRNTSVANVRDATKKTLDLNNRLIMRVVPAQTPVTPNPRAAQPALGTPKPFNPQQPTSFTLSNGIRVQYWYRPELPLMSMTTAFALGADIDDSANQGLASLTADMLSQGSGSYTAESFEDALNLLGANFSATAGHSQTTVSLSTLTRNFDKALSLYADAMLRPKLSAEDFSRVQRLTASAIEQSEDNPTSVAGRVAMREYFGEQHPYGRPVAGSVPTVKSLSLDLVKSEHKRIFNANQALIYAAGSLSESEFKTQLEKNFAGWKGDPIPMSILRYNSPANKDLRVVIVDKPGAVQTVVEFLMPAPNYDSSDRTTLEALGTILGGSFTSRLNQNLREDKGYTYGAFSGFTFTKNFGYLQARSSVRTDVTGASIKEFLAEFTKIRGGDVTEVEAAKAAATRRNETVESLGSLGGFVGTAVRLAAVGHSFADISTDLAETEKVKAAQINALVKASVALENGLLVLVGDEKEITKQLAGLPLPKATLIK